MKISPVAVRRLRTERGWSQEQLAIASGLSLRTVQRVEAEGIASLGTATSLAATYQVKLTELQECQVPNTGQKPTAAPIILIFGLAILTLASIGESGRLPGFPSSDGLAAINITTAIAGALLVIPSLARLIQQRKFIGTGLAMLGTPLITLLATGLVFASVSGHIPTWQLGALGLAGIGLVFISLRELGRAAKSAEA